MKKQTLGLRNPRASTSFQFDYLVFIGRFQPFHLGHQKVIDTALMQADRVIVLVGSSAQPRCVRNPWTYLEREQFILSSFSEERHSRLIIAPLLDDVYNEQNWLSRVQKIVHGIACQSHPKVGQSLSIGLCGHSKDQSSYYLSLFPQWTSVNVDAYQKLSATPLRQAYFLKGEISDSYPEPVMDQLQSFQKTGNYQTIASEWRFIQSYKKGWEAAPYEPVFVTVDALVVQSGHVLLVERKASPGKGLYALPGGFINPQEKLKDAVIRELREETRIKVPAPVLAGSIVKEQVFDDPYRSARGRTITHAFLIELKPDAKGLPAVRGSDDAKHAFWMPLGQVDPERLFEDHFHIINAMID